MTIELHINGEVVLTERHEDIKDDCTRIGMMIYKERLQKSIDMIKTIWEKVLEHEDYQIFLVFPSKMNSNNYSAKIIGKYRKAS